jgi:hypothetical protein
MAETKKERQARLAAEAAAASANPGAKESNVNDNPSPDQEPKQDESNGTTTPGEQRPVLDPLTDPLKLAHLADAVRQGIADGHIRSVPAKSTIRAKSSPTNKDEEQPFINYVPVDAEGCLILSGNKEQAQTQAPEDGDDTRTEEEKKLGLVDYFAHGFYLKEFNNYYRDLLLDSIAGPEKEIVKAVKNMLAAKMAKTEAGARNKVIAGRILLGHVVPATDMAAFLAKHNLTEDTLEAWRIANAEEE